MYFSNLQQKFFLFFDFHIAKDNQSSYCYLTNNLIYACMHYTRFLYSKKMKLLLFWTIKFHFLKVPNLGKESYDALSIERRKSNSLKNSK